MSDPTKEALEELRLASERELEKAKAKHELITAILDALPEGTPAPKQINPFGYCATASMMFAGAGLEERLLELYPPLPLVSVRGSTVTQKPEKYLREEDHHSSVEPIFPAVIRCDTRGETLRWWTTLVGHDVEMRLYSSGDSLHIPADPRLYEETKINYSQGTATFLKRRRALATGLKKSAYQRWLKAWDDFCDRHQFAPMQRKVVAAIYRQIEEVKPDTPFTLESLPEPDYLAPGSAIAIGEGEDMLEKLETLRQKQLNRKPHPFDYYGFWRHFTLEEAKALVEFAEAQRRALLAVREEERRDYDHIAKVIREFFADRGVMPESVIGMRDLLEEHLRRASGYDVRFRLMRGYRNPDRMKLSPYFDPQDAFPDIEVPCKPGELLKMQDIPVIYAT